MAQRSAPSANGMLPPGELLETVSISYRSRYHCYIRTWLSPDARTILLGELFPATTLFLFDAKTGQRRGVRVEDVAGLAPVAFSQDARWFSASHSQGNPLDKRTDGIDIVDTRTGRRVVELRERNGEELLDCCFSPGGDAVAVHWRKRSNSAAHDSVRIVELPGGRELRQFDLLPRPCQRIYQWVNDRLCAEVNVSNYIRQSCSFDLSAKSVGQGRPEPQLIGQVYPHEGQTVWDSGSGWVASQSLDQREPEKWETWLEWIAPKVGMKFQAERGPVNSVRIFDPATGRLRYELPRRLRSRGVISNDGRIVASLQPDVDSASMGRRPAIALAMGIRGGHGRSGGSPALTVLATHGPGRVSSRRP